MIRKNASRKIATVILTGILSIAMTATVMAAPGGPGGFGGPQRPSFEEGERPELPEFEEGERPELPEFEEGERPELPEFEEGERPELPEFEEEERPELPEGEESRCPEMNKERGMRGDRGMQKMDINIENIQTAIESVEDETVKAELEALLEEYNDARTALETAIEEGSDDTDTYRKAEMEAMKALREALDEAGIDTRGESDKKEEGSNTKNIDKLVNWLKSILS